MDSIISQIRDLSAKADEAGQKKILDELRNLSLELETPGDTIQRLIFLPLQTSSARIANDLQLFTLVNESKAPINTATAVEKTGASKEFLGRFLRYLSTVGMLKEVSEDQFTSTNISRTLTMPGLKAGVNFATDIMAPCFGAFPTYLAANKYGPVTNPTHTAFQAGLHTDLDAFSYLQQNPAKLGDFMMWMTAQRQGMPTWLSVFPVEQETKGVTADRAVFVDVGGAVGHQCRALRAQYPQLQGRVILQDLPPMIAMAGEIEGVEKIPQDFFTPQQVKDAKFYYMRNVLHDHPDDRAQLILKQTISAMGKDSVILIDEMVVPDVGAHWQSLQLDIFMMSSLGAVERTKKQWYALLESVGLKIVHIYTYTDLLQDSVIYAVPV